MSSLLVNPLFFKQDRFNQYSQILMPELSHKEVLTFSPKELYTRYLNPSFNNIDISNLPSEPLAEDSILHDYRLACWPPMPFFRSHVYDDSSIEHDNNTQNEEVKFNRNLLGGWLPPVINADTVLYLDPDHHGRAVTDYSDVPEEQAHLWHPDDSGWLHGPSQRFACMGRSWQRSDRKRRG